jgi:hypothetical protein
MEKISNPELADKTAGDDAPSFEDKFGKGWQFALFSELCAGGLGLYLIITGDAITATDRVLIGICASLRISTWLFSSCININILLLLITLVSAADISYICVRTDSFNSARGGDVMAMLFYYLNTVAMNCNFIENSVTFVNWVVVINSGNALVVVNKDNIAFSVLNTLQMFYSVSRNLYLSSFVMRLNKDIMRASLTKDELDETKELLETAEGTMEYLDIVVGLSFTICYYALSITTFKSFVAFAFINWLGSGSSKLSSFIAKCRS